MTHDIPNAIARSANVQNALGLLMTAIRHEARQRKVSANDTLIAVDSAPLDAEIEALIVQRFTQVLEAKQCSTR